MIKINNVNVLVSIIDHIGTAMIDTRSLVTYLPLFHLVRISFHIIHVFQETIDFEVNLYILGEGVRSGVGRSQF